MTLYQQRMSPIWELLKSGRENVGWNNNLSKSSRKGEYLIKKIDKFECLHGIGYVHHGFRDDGWAEWTTRENAAWFTKEEAKEITKNWRGIKIVKK